MENHEVHDYKEATSIVPPHEIRDKEKVARLTDSMKKNGWQGRPILTVDLGAGHEALTGSHRIVAAQKAGVEVPIHTIPSEVGDHEDKHGRTIRDAMYMEADDAAKWLKDAGHHEASALMMDEHRHQK